MKNQKRLIQNLDKTLDKAKQQQDRLTEINLEQKEKNALNFNDQREIKDFLQQQQRQEAQMEKFSKELKDNLQKKNDGDARLNQLLQERLERQELAAKKNQKLLEELEKIADKINKGDLGKRLEELGKNQQNNERSLAQLVELTKRYYVTEKAAQIARDLDKLSKEQKRLAEKPSTPQAQETLNEKYRSIENALEELGLENEDLKKPLSLALEPEKQDAISKDQKDALEELQKEPSTGASEESKDAQRKQRSAGAKMKELSEALASSSARGGGGDGTAEDAEMLRQILDNLIIFSFKQEQLFDEVNGRQDRDVAQYGRTVRSQKRLKDLFTHVDDSLFALSLRQAELAEFVNEQITEVYYNIDKSLERMAEGQMYQGASSQKYVLNAANGLADYLANIMDNMQQNMQMGQGSGNNQQGFQLPDIIQGQGDISKKMGSKGQEGKQGQEGQEGSSGSEGSSGEAGKGQQGEGESGQNGSKNGENRSDGTSGQGKNGSNGEGSQGGADGNTSGSDGLTEGELKEIYEIYQEQQRIKAALEEQLGNMINNKDRALGAKLLRQMEDFQNDLLENGITQRTIDKANTIQYELLKLENAALRQGEKQKREAQTNLKDYSNPVTTKPSLLDNYRNETEILNRQALPLRQNFKNKVKAYFKEQ